MILGGKSLQVAELWTLDAKFAVMIMIFQQKKVKLSEITHSEMPNPSLINPSQSSWLCKHKVCFTCGGNVSASTV